MVESGRSLHQRVETAPLGPGTCGTIGRQRDIDDTGIDARGILRREAEAADRARPVALRKDIRLRQQIAQHAAPLFALEFDKTRQLPAPGVDGEPRDRRQVGAGDQQHVGAMRGERPARHGTGDHPRQIEHANARKRPLAAGPGFWRRLTDLRDRDQRQSSERPSMRRCRPLLMRAHEGDDAAAGIGRGLERFAVPLHQRGLNRVTLRLAVQHLADGVAVVREVGVQPHEAIIAGFVDSGDGVPGRRRRLAVDAQIAFAPAFNHGMAHIDRDVLHLAAAHFPDLGRRQPGRGDADLCGGCDAKRRWQLRLIAGQRERVEREGFAAGRGPDTAEDFSGGLHERVSSLTSSPASQAT